MSSNLETVRHAVDVLYNHFQPTNSTASFGVLAEAAKIVKEYIAALPAEPDKPAKIWQVGNTGKYGGTIVKVYPPGDRRVALECRKEDGPRLYSWFEVFNGTKEGYFLPTLKQMRYIAEAVELADDWYWTRDEADATRAYVFLKSGSSCDVPKTEPHRVRAVRFIGERGSK